MSTQPTQPEVTYGEEVLVVEPHGIEHIREDERHGRMSGQFNVWFAANMHLSSIVLGALGVTLGLGFWGAVWSCIIGNILGALGVSLCVAMGPRLGMPQLPMSRSAFGYRGNYIPAFLAWIGYFGWFAVDNILAAQTVQQLFHSPYTIAALIFGLATIVIAIYGYNFVHAWERWLTWASLITFGILTIITVAHGFGPSVAATKSGIKYWETFFLEFSIIFSYTVSWAPYGADYARYLPADTPVRKPFWYSFWGMFLSCQWAMVLGALLGTLGVKGGAVPAIAAAGGAFATVAFVVILLGSISSNVLNMYSGGMSGLTWDMPLKRTGAALVIGIIGLGLSLFFGGPQFVKFYESFLFILIYWCTPWIAIIGIDFYLFHNGGRGYPNVLEFYKKNGIFGSVRWSGLLALLIGIAVSVPFMATDLYTGPIGKALGDADFSYIVSFIVAGLIYLVAGRPQTVTKPSSAAADD